MVASLRELPRYCAAPLLPGTTQGGDAGANCAGARVVLVLVMTMVVGERADRRAGGRGPLLPLPRPALERTRAHMHQPEAPSMIPATTLRVCSRYLPSQPSPEGSSGGRLELPLNPPPPASPRPPLPHLLDLL